MGNPSTAAPPTFKVFLSYSSLDAALARRLALDLRAAKVDVWLDQWELRIGETFEQSIERGVDDAAFVIVLLTRASVASDWVRREWSRKVLDEARQQKVGVIPVRAERCEIPDFLAQRSHADISGGSYPMGLRHLLEILRHHAGDAGIAVPEPVLAESELDMKTLPIVVPIALEVSHDLRPIFEHRDAGINRFLDELLPKMQEQLTAEIGFRFPGVRVWGNQSGLPEGTALIMIDEVPESLLSVDRDNVERGASEQMIAALHETIRKQAADFIDVDIARHLVNEVAQENPALIGQVVPKVVNWFGLVDVLRRLVAENVGIGDMGSILAALAQETRYSSDTVDLAEKARHALAAQITARFTDGCGPLSVFRLSPDIEASMRDALQATRSSAILALDPQLTQDILSAVRRAVAAHGGAAAGAAILTGTRIRPYVRKLVELEFPWLYALSDHDLLPATQIRIIDEISLDAARCQP
jgi:hypothetical protein